MKFLNRHKKQSFVFAIIVAVLIFTYFWGGNIPDNNYQEKTDTVVAVLPEKIKTESVNLSEKSDIIEENSTQENEEMTGVSEDMLYSVLQGMEINEKTGLDVYNTEPVTPGHPIPVEPENAVISDKEMTCTLSIRCDTILDNIDFLDESKITLVPSNGIILAEKTVTFCEGESVFDVLLRETRKNSIHMEYVDTPIYNSAYIEGINNLYEFDCGELSGWMYSVNGWFPNYGCSRYSLKEGDRIEWVYTCNLGKDVKN